MSLTQRKWTNLLAALENDTCIVLLGPAMSVIGSENVPLYSRFAAQICRELDAEGVSYDKGLKSSLPYVMQQFLKIDGVGLLDLGHAAQRFYKKFSEQTGDLHKKLASLPVSLVINTTPDHLIVKALKDSGKYNTQHAWYNYCKDANPEIPKPSKDAPFVYNLFGYYDDPLSLVLTESDQVQFLSNVVKDQPPLPPKLRSQFYGLKTYLFLGFDWGKWTLKMLLSSLIIDSKNNFLAHSQMQHEPDPVTSSFYESSFGSFTFIQDDINVFLDELISRYKAENGGSTSSVESPPKRIFIAGHSKDDGVRNGIFRNLKQYPFNIWHEGILEAGDESDVIIRQKITEADVILLLISSDFIGSDELFERELALALQRFKTDKAPVIPVIVRPCAWQAKPELTQLPVILPRNEGGEVLSLSLWENEDEAINRVTKAISELVLGKG